MNVHIGSSGRLAITAPDAPMDVMITLQPMNIVQAAADLLWSKPIKEYPDLKIALSEGGTGWIPYFLERADRTYRDALDVDQAGLRRQAAVSEVFREHFLTCFISDHVGVQLRNDDRHRQHLLGGRLPAQRLDVAGRPRAASRGAHRAQRARRRDQQDDVRERDALVLVRPVQPHHPGNRPRSARCARPPKATTSPSGRSATTRRRHQLRRLRRERQGVDRQSGLSRHRTQCAGADEPSMHRRTCMCGI